jgi:hypothetical protein
VPGDAGCECAVSSNVICLRISKMAWKTFFINSHQGYACFLHVHRKLDSFRMILCTA